MAPPWRDYTLPLRRCEPCRSTERSSSSGGARRPTRARFVPALFAEWAPQLVELAGVAPGQAVLDVACGTGIVARTAADTLRGAGRVVGLDLNEACWPSPGAFARRSSGGRATRRAAFRMRRSTRAVPDGLMFFPDRVGAFGEMRRVVTAGGTVAVVVPGSAVVAAGYGPFVATGARHAGPEAVSLLSTYWACGDLDELTAPDRVGRLDVVARTASARPGSIRSTPSWRPRWRARHSSTGSARTSTRASATELATCCGRSRQRPAASKHRSKAISSPPEER